LHVLGTCADPNHNTIVFIINLRNACSNILIVKISNICKSGVNGDGYIMSSKLFKPLSLWRLLNYIL